MVFARANFWRMEASSHRVHRSRSLRHFRSARSSWASGSISSFDGAGTLHRAKQGRRHLKAPQWKQRRLRGRNLKISDGVEGGVSMRQAIKQLAFVLAFSAIFVLEATT